MSIFAPFLELQTISAGFRSVLFRVVPDVMHRFVNLITDDGDYNTAM
ncbi:MAG TPA: hypothetical protein VIE90_02460 [Candidatus Binatia bacterium]|jgi:hypothetical protein